MRETTCCFTGHRVLPAQARADITQRLEAELDALLQRGYRSFCAGGALGFDTLAAQAVLRRRGTCPDIRLRLFLPCRSQADQWRAEDRAVYEAILAQADEVQYISEHYFSGCMQMRNRRLVEASSACLCYLRQAHGGTAYTVRYAQKQGLAIINVAG